LEAICREFSDCSGSVGARELLQGIDVGGARQFVKNFYPPRNRMTTELQLEPRRTMQLK
jgi:hypothetical protein